MYTASCDFHIIVQTKYNKYISEQKNIGSRFKFFDDSGRLVSEKKMYFFLQNNGPRNE